MSKHLELITGQKGKQEGVNATQLRLLRVALEHVGSSGVVVRTV